MVGEDHGVQRVVRDQYGDGLEVGQVAAELRADVEAGAGVEGRERFVEEQQPGAGGQGAGEGDALGLAAGEPARFGGGVPGETQALQPGGGLRPGLRLGRAPAARPEGHVVERGQVREEQVVLEDDPDRPGLRRRTVQLRSVEPQMTVRERDETGEGAQGGGLPGAVRAQQRDDVAGGRGQGHVESEAAPLDDEPRVEPPSTARSPAAVLARAVSFPVFLPVFFPVSVMRRSSSGRAVRRVRRRTRPAVPG